VRPGPVCRPCRPGRPTRSSSGTPRTKLPMPPAPPPIAASAWPRRRRPGSRACGDRPHRRSASASAAVPRFQTSQLFCRDARDQAPLLGVARGSPARFRRTPRATAATAGPRPRSPGANHTKRAGRTDRAATPPRGPRRARVAARMPATPSRSERRSVAANPDSSRSLAPAGMDRHTRCSCPRLWLRLDSAGALRPPGRT
jgi:hypothetical protein